MVSLIITSFYINFGTSTNVFKKLIRLSDTSKATKARIEKIGQYKLGPGGYSNLAAQYVSITKPKSASKYHTDYYFCFVLTKGFKINGIMQIWRPTDSKNFPVRITWSLASNMALMPLLNTREACLWILHNILLIHLVPWYVKTVQFNDNLLILMQFVPYK